MDSRFPGRAHWSDFRGHGKQAGSGALSGSDRAGKAGMVLFVVVAVLPVLHGFLYAVAYSTGLIGLLNEGMSWQAWRQNVQSTVIWKSIGWSLYIAVTTTGLAVFGAIAVAIGLGRTIREGWLNRVIRVPVAVPAIVSAFLVFQLFTNSGFVAGIISESGFPSIAERIPSLVHDRFGFGIMAAYLFMGIPWFTIIFIQVGGGEHVDDLQSVARSLGATRLAAIRKVAVPVLIHRAMPLIVLYFVAVLGAYEIPLILGRQSPEMLSVLTMRKYSLFDLSQRPDAFVASLSYTFIALASLVLAARKGWLTR